MTVVPTTGEIIPTVSGAMTPEAAAERAQWIRDIQRAALSEGVDYGTIPGTERPTLFKSGAEMLLLAAGYGHTNRPVPNPPGSPEGVTYRCVVRRRDRSIVATCDGFAGYDESRFRYRTGRAPWNTLVKMAQKRALVGAALNACAASGLFLADMDDNNDTNPTDTGTNARAADPPCNDDTSTTYDDADDAEAINRATAAVSQASPPVAKAFSAWRRQARMAWPPQSGDDARRAAVELGRIKAEADG